jgi:chromosome segregation ATPase
MDDKLNMILDQIADTQDKQASSIEALKESVIRQEISLETHIDQTRQMNSKISDINDRLSEYNAQLQIHIAGVQQLKEMNTLIREELKQREKELEIKLSEAHEKINSRLEVAEEPIKWLKTAGVYAKWVGSIGSAIGMIYVLVKFLAAL